MEGASRSLPLAGGTSGPMFAQAVVYAAIGIGLAAAGLLFLASVPSHRPGPCEAGRVSAAGVAIAFLCIGVVIGRPALYDVIAAIRGRRSGSVTLTGSTLVLDVPGLVRQPCTIHRAWIDEVRLVEEWGRRPARHQWQSRGSEVLGHEALCFPGLQSAGSARAGRVRAEGVPTVCAGSAVALDTSWRGGCSAGRSRRLRERG